MSNITVLSKHNCRLNRRMHSLPKRKFASIINNSISYNNEQTYKLTLEAVKTGSKAMIYRVSKKFARIQRTQKPFSGYIYLMCRVLAHVYLLTCSFSQYRVFILELKKLMIHVLSEVRKRKTVDSCCFIVISKCYDLHVLFFLNTIKISFKTKGFVKTC